MNKPNTFEIGKIIQSMTTDYKAAPNYNQAAADIVTQGIADKARAKLGYEPVVAKPVTKPSPKTTL